jgi:hypothetical protein
MDDFLLFEQKKGGSPHGAENPQICNTLVEESFKNLVEGHDPIQEIGLWVVA